MDPIFNNTNLTYDKFVGGKISLDTVLISMLGENLTQLVAMITSPYSDYLNMISEYSDLL